MLDIGGGAAMAAGAAAAGAATAVAGAAGIASSMAQFASAAASGAFAVSPTGGEALLRAISTMKDGIGDIQVDVGGAGLQIPLGLSHGANVMATVDTEVAHDEQGFIPMLVKFVDSLDAAEQGIRTAMQNYAAMDERGAGRQQSA